MTRIPEGISMPFEASYKIGDMRFVESLSPERTALDAAAGIASFIDANSKSTISFGMGPSVYQVYDALATSGVNARGIRAFLLNEFVGVHPQRDEDSLGRQFHERIIARLEIKNAHSIDGLQFYPEFEAERYQLLLSQYPSDLVIISIGRNGQIAFIEPGTSFELGVHVKQLSERVVNKKQTVREFGITQGIRNLRAAKQIIVILNGREEGEYFRDAFTGMIGPNYPASFLREFDVARKVVVYHDVFAGKPISYLRRGGY